MTMLALDYSSGHPSGAAIKAAGYDAVIRYVGTPGRPKNITTAEYQDMLTAGVSVALVYENTAQDALGGFPAGEAAARAARADADSIGFPANRPIYFAVDWQATAPQMNFIGGYLLGAADVLGAERVGVYGFELTIRSMMDWGYARWFWQCGSRAALVPGTHLYQHNNDNTSVSGITCDVNDALAPDFGQNPQPKEIDVLQDERDALLDIREQLCGSRAQGQFPGWQALDGTGRNLTAVDMLRETHRETNQRIASRVPGATSVDTVLGYAANADAFGYQLLQLVGTLLGKVDGLTAALTQLTQHGSVDLAAVANAAEAGARKVFAGATWSATGTVSPTKAPVQPAPGATPTPGVTL